MKKFLKKVKALFTNRLAVLFVVMTVMFLALVLTLYDIQIVRGHEFPVPARRVQTSTRTVFAPRGEIFDRNGQPLAVNRTTTMLKFDTNINPFGRNDAQINAMLISFIRTMERFGETILDTLPISDTEPREFLLGGRESRERVWKRDMRIGLDLTAQESYNALIDKFNIPEDTLTPREVRELLILREAIYLQRYQRNPITVAIQIGPAVQAALEERNQEFPGFFIDVDYLREYPMGRYVSHIIGYIRPINSDQLEHFAEYGYTHDFIVGHQGIESAFELDLQGIRGSITMETDPTGRRLGLLDYQPAIAGNDVFLTVDSVLQRQIYEILERRLSDIIIARLRSSRDCHVPMRTFLASMVRTNNVPVFAALSADEGSLCAPIRFYIKSNLDYINESETYRGDIVRFVANELEAGRITENQLLLLMYETGIIAPTESELQSLIEGNLHRAATLSLIVRMLQEGHITPAMTGTHPNTASVVLTCVATGGVLASVSYPSYDNNRFVNEFDNAYWTRLINDPLSPMFNRPFQERRAVGSTFKMLTAVAVLENGIITPTTRIFDNFVFIRDGVRFGQCNRRHGSINVVQAIAQSCNYFFYDTSFRLGIRPLNEVMIQFGMGQPTGVEIFDINRALAQRYGGVIPIASPEFRFLSQGRRWFDGDTVHVSIGQGDNTLTAAEMARYTAVFATGGDRLQMHFLSHIVAHDGTVVDRFEPVVELTVPMSQSTLDAVRRGMRDTTSDTRGTGHATFRGFPVQIASKTGTTQEVGWRNHSSFAAYAPFNNPSVALYVVIQGSVQSTIPAPAALVSRDILEVYFRLDSEPQRPQETNVLVKR